MLDPGKSCDFENTAVPARPAASILFTVLLRALSDRRGVSSLLFGLSATVILGVVGLTVQGGTWYSDYVNLQTIADAASTAGAVGIAAGESKTQYIASARYVLQQNGVVNGQNGVTVTVNSPPASGPNASNDSAVEVILSKTESLGIAGMYLTSRPLATVRSVANYGSAVGTCALALGNNLGSSNNGTFTMSGGATLTATGCAVSANNTSSQAFYLYPSPHVTAETIISAGAVASSCGQGPTGCGNVLTLTKPYSQYHVASVDPLAAVQSVPLPASSTFSPPSSTCTTTVTFPQWNSPVTLSAGTSYCGLTANSNHSVTIPADGGTYTFTNNVSISGNLYVGSGDTFSADTIYIKGSLNLNNAGTYAMALPSGTYVVNGGITVSDINASIAYHGIPSTFYITGNLTVTGSGVFDIAPGTYFIYNGSLIVNSGGSLTCSSCVAGGAGVTFVLMGTSPGAVNVSGSAPMTFSSPANSNYNSGLNGVAIYEVPGDTSTNNLAGSGTMNLQGAFYAPNAVLDISGAAGTSSTTCTVYVANTIIMTGSGYAGDSNCAQYGYSWATSGPTPNGVTLVE